MDFNGIRRLYLPLRPKARFSPGRKTPPSVSAPSTGLRPLNDSRVKCGGLNRTLKRIAAICGIERKLVFHCGRHTYATEITLSHGVPLETVSKMPVSYTHLDVYKRQLESLDSVPNRNLCALYKIHTLYHSTGLRSEYCRM